MKKLVCLMLCLVMALSVVNALAFNYQQRFDNEATFETLEEARINEVEYLTGAMGKTYVADPALDSYPEGTTYIMRSSGIYSAASAGPRMNTTILVYTDANFESKEDAKAYLVNLGLDKIIEEAVGSVVLVTPATPVSEGSSGITGGFAQADQYAFFQLQMAMTNINGNVAGGAAADNNYYGGLTYRYIIGIDGGATFINNYIASTYDYVTRIAGMLLVNGDMERIRDVASFVPVYLVNSSDMAIEKYKAANEVDAWAYDGDDVTYFNQAQPLQKVVVSAATELNAELVDDVYHNFLIKAMRNAVIKSGLNNASTLYSNYNFNQAPYSLDRRNAIVNGKTADGLVVTEHHEDRFQNICREDNGEYLDTWWEVLPEEVLNGTAPEHSVPLVLCNHGSGDDPMQYVDETGWLLVAGDNRVALVVPFHQNIGTSMDPGIRYEALPALVEYMLAEYPALDPSRVYATGYSMGGGATYATIYGKPELFAAVVPMAAMPRVSWATEEQTALFDDLDLPIMITTSTADLYMSNERITDDYEGILDMIFGFNGIAPHAEPDFDTYPMVGIKADHYRQIVINNQFNNYQWTFDNDAGVPMVAVNITDFLPHGLYPQYGLMAWNFMSHYARDTETLDVIYTPYVR